MTNRTFLRITLCAAVTTAAARGHADSCVPGFHYGAFAKRDIDFGGNSSLDSYNSTAGSYANTRSNSGGDLGTNGNAPGSVTLHGTASSVYGNVDYGVGGTSSTVTVHGHPTVGTFAAQAVNLVLPSVVVPSLGANLGARSGGTLAPGNTYTSVSGNVTVPAGTYVVGSLGGTLTLSSGPVVFYVTTAFSADIVNNIPSSPGTPGNLVFMVGPNVSSLNLPDGSYAMYAPDTDLSFHGNTDFYGTIVGSSIDITGTPNLHYDRALASLKVGAFDCSPLEVSRASPVVAAISNQTAVVQGTFIPPSATAKTITDVASIPQFTFPWITGHMRARVASTITATGSKFSSGTIVFDAAATGKIPGVSYAGCTSKTGGCRNVFTITSTPGSTGVQFHPTAVQLNDTNASAIGALIAPPSVIAGIGPTHWQTLVRTVLAAALGGVDRSTVAVIGASAVAGSATRPTIGYFGATDGMIHAVCASTGGTTASASNICSQLGAELWAFLPRVQLPLIRSNTARVDGSPRVVDVFGDFSGNPATGTQSWHTILTFQTGFAVGTTPAAYAIDITDPASPIVLWEYATLAQPGSLDLGTGLTVAAGPTLINGRLTNVAILQTSNGGSGGTGVVATAVSAETGSKLWQFGFVYPSPPRGVTADTALLPTTGIVGGAVGVDLTGKGLLTDVVFGDLYGDLWRLNAADGTSRNGAGTPLFRFSSNKHPIGAKPAIYSSNGTQYAAFASGGYADPTAMSWTTSQQYLIAARLTSTGAAVDETAPACSTCALALASALSAGDKGFSQALVVGNQLFVTTDASDVNLQAYGSVSSSGHAIAVDLTGTPSLSTIVVNAGGSSLVNSGTTLYNSSGAQQATLSTSASSTSGPSVNSTPVTDLIRLMWLRTQ